MNIYLIGMMGSGKSVTGRRLAALLGFTFLDLDEQIQKKTGLTIPEIFSKEGETFFRDRESEILKDASKGDLRVVATGGGAVLRSSNVELMRVTGKTVFLETSPGILWDRVRDKKDRPLLHSGQPQEKLLEIYAYRLPIYKGAADLTVNTDGKTAAAVAEEIQELIRVHL